MNFRAKAIRLGGYFTLGLILLTVLFSGLEPIYATLLSLSAGLSFTLSCVFVGVRNKLD